MVTKELISYINQQIALGKNRDQIKLELIQGGGWLRNDIDEAFESLQSTTSTPRKTSGAWIVILVLMLISGGAVFAAYKFNIRSYQDIQTVLFPNTSNEKVVPIKESQDSAISIRTSKELSEYERELLEENIIGYLMTIQMTEKATLMKTGRKSNVCFNSDYIVERVDLIKILNNNYFPISEANYYCNGDENTFVASLPLPNNGYFCIDSTGFADVVDRVPTTTSCGQKSTQFTVNQDSINAMRDFDTYMNSPEGIARKEAAMVQANKEAEYRKYLGIRSSAELVYDPSSSYSGACIAIKKEVPEATCFENSDAYAASYALSASSGGGYSCVDSTDFYGKIMKPLTSTGCPR